MVDKFQLQEYRREIDKLDYEIIALLEVRFSLTDRIGEIKKNTDMQVEDIQREMEIYDKIKDNNIRKVYDRILEVSKQSQNSLN